MDFSDISQFVPDFVDPVLAYLESVLPPPLYSALFTGGSTVLALSTALLSFLSTSPSTWTAEKIIPPLITILAAYLALSSLYRTIKLTLWFMKWGTILAVVMGGIGWLISGGVSDLLAYEGENGRSRSRSSSPSPPRAWESWDRHDTYRQQRQQRTRGQNGADDVQKFIQDLTGVAGRVFAQSGDWWEIAKGAVEELGKQPQGGTGGSSNRKTKSKTGKTTGTR